MDDRLRRWAIPAASGALIIAALILGQAAPPVGDWVMLAAAVVAGAPVVKKAWSALRVRVIGIDLLVSVAAIGAILIRNFWEAAAVTFLFALGHALENATLAKTRSALAELVALAPTTATVIRDGAQVEVPAHTVAVGETVIVKNGGRIPVDARVVSGQAAVDEAAITGESIPVEKGEGAEVFAGTIVADGFLTLSATGVGADTTLARIVHRVEEAQDAKARTQQFMERFSKWYTPGIIALSVVVGLITMDLELALTLLVIGCPGALVISVPVALVAGIGRAARDGILIKGGEFLETAARIDVVALDKTGTITRGEPTLVRVLSAPQEARVLGLPKRETSGVAGRVLSLPQREASGASSGVLSLPQRGASGRSKDPIQTPDHEVLRWAALAEAGSEHPLAVPVLRAAREAGIAVPAVPDAVRSVPGHGVIAEVEGREVAVGNLALMEEVVPRYTRSFLAGTRDSGVGDSFLAGTRDSGVGDSFLAGIRDPGVGSSLLGSARDAGVGGSFLAGAQDSFPEDARGSALVWAESAVEELSAAGQTPLLVAVDGEVIGALGVADTIRDEAPALVESLHSAGVKRVLMLTGDNQRVADAVAAQVGIDDARASLLPEDKLDVIRQLQAEGHTVAMVGDGVNDAPALALADIGIAMGAAGSPVAIETADIALMTSHLGRIPEAISLAKRTARVMRANIAIALVTVGLLLAGVLFGGVTMAIGMLVHEASVLVVIVNAMRLLRRRRARGTVSTATPAPTRREPALAS